MAPSHRIRIPTHTRLDIIYTRSRVNRQVFLYAACAVEAGVIEVVLSLCGSTKAFPGTSAPTPVN